MRERRVRFLLEHTVVSASPPDAAVPDADPAAPPEAPVCSNGPPAELRSGAPLPRELEELEQRIAGAQERLRQALLRRRALLAQLGDSTCEPPCTWLLACEEAPEVAS